MVTESKPRHVTKYLGNLVSSKLTLRFISATSDGISGYFIVFNSHVFNRSGDLEFVSLNKQCSVKSYLKLEICAKMAAEFRHRIQRNFIGS
jgi:hypothetical protein